MEGVIAHGGVVAGGLVTEQRKVTNSGVVVATYERVQRNSAQRRVAGPSCQLGQRAPANRGIVGAIAASR